MGIISDGLEIMKLVNMGANAELFGKLAKFVEEAQELKAKVEKLDEANRSLREQLRFKGTVVRVAGCMYIEGDEEQICSHCAEVDNIPVHVSYQVLEKLGRTAMCPRCKNKAYPFLKRSNAEEMVKQGQL